MTAVFDRYPNGGGEMILALALADHASDDGCNIFPSIKTLAEKTRQSERTVQYQLRRMEETGWLVRVSAGNGGRSQSTEYRIAPAWIKGADFASLEKKGANDGEKGATDDTKGCNPRQETVQPVAPANNRHRTINEPSLFGADAPKPKTIRATSMPIEFTPDQTAVDLASKLGVNLDDEIAAFADHHTANGSTFKDWQAALRTWLRNAHKFARRDSKPSRRGPPPPDNFSAVNYGAPRKL